MSDPYSGTSHPSAANRLRTYSVAALLVSVGLCTPGNRGYGPPWLWTIGQIVFFASLAGLAASFLWRITEAVIDRFKTRGH